MLLAHGAAGNAASMLPWTQALEALGVPGETVPVGGKLPGKAERAVEVYRAQVAGRREVVIGGQSYGGRMASMLAAEDEVAGLVLLSYPLHPPGKTDQQRVQHLGSIKCPVLFLSGEADPFARLDLLRAAVARVPRAELVTYPGVGHGLSRDRAAMADAVGRIAEFARR